MIKAIVACDEEYGIAKDGQIPWHNKEDFLFFKKMTKGRGNNAVVMGRKTKESLPIFPLPDRENIVLTSHANKPGEIENWTVLDTKPYDTTWIIGGANVYDYAFRMRFVEEIYISRIPGNYECDQFIKMDIINENYRLDQTLKMNGFNVEIWKKR